MTNSGTKPMLDLVLELPEQIVSGARAACEADLGPAARGRRVEASTPFRAVAVAGMGGSGISARIVQGLLLDKLGVPLFVCNDYDLPAAVTSGALFVAVSHSGNTEETLSGFAQARARRCRIVAITSGGDLGRDAAKAGITALNCTVQPFLCAMRRFSSTIRSISIASLPRIRAISTDTRSPSMTSEKTRARRERPSLSIHMARW